MALTRDIEVRAPHRAERDAALAQLNERWGGPIVVSRGVVHALAELPLLVAVQGAALAGCLTWRRDGAAVEIVTLDAFVEHVGVGSALLRAALDLAPRVWLVTTNDNLRAQSFYGFHGGRLVAVHAGAVTRARELKPGIPTLGANGIPIADELEYEWTAPAAP